MKRNTAMKLVNSRTPQQWAAEIRSDEESSVAAIFRSAMKIEASHEELGAATWLKQLIREHLKWSRTKGYSYLAIAQDERLADVPHVGLPASYETLNQITRLTDEQFETGIKSGVIHAGMERKDIAQLKPPKEKRNPAPATKIRKSVLPRDEVVEEEVYSLVVSVIHEMDEEHCIDFFERMRSMLDQLERTAKANRTPVGAVQ